MDYLKAMLLICTTEVDSNKEVEVRLCANHLLLISDHLPLASHTLFISPCWSVPFAIWGHVLQCAIYLQVRVTVKPDISISLDILAYSKTRTNRSCAKIMQTHFFRSVLEILFK